MALTRLSTLTSAIAVSLPLAVVAAPAQAQSVGVYDFDGAASAINIDRVDYDFTADGVSATVSIPGLRRKGSVSFFASLPYSDGITEARYVIRNGRLIKRYRSVGMEYTRIPCQLRGGWNARTNLVKITIPEACLSDFATTDVLALETASKLGRFEDRTAAVELARG